MHAASVWQKIYIFQPSFPGQYDTDVLLIKNIWLYVSCCLKGVKGNHSQRITCVGAPPPG